MNKHPYHLGRLAEYKIRDYYASKGYVVFRLAGSKPFDLIALRNDEILLIEVKRGTSFNKEEVLKKLNIVRHLYPDLPIRVLVVLYKPLRGKREIREVQVFP